MVTNNETAATAEPTRVTNATAFDGKKIEILHANNIRVYVSFGNGISNYIPTSGLEETDATVYGEASVGNRTVRCSDKTTVAYAGEAAAAMHVFLRSLGSVGVPF